MKIRKEDFSFIPGSMTGSVDRCSGFNGEITRLLLTSRPVSERVTLLSWAVVKPGAIITRFLLNLSGSPRTATASRYALDLAKFRNLNSCIFSQFYSNSTVLESERIYCSLSDEGGSTSCITDAGRFSIDYILLTILPLPFVRHFGIMFEGTMATKKHNLQLICITVFAFEIWSRSWQDELKSLLTLLIKFNILSNVSYAAKKSLLTRPVKYFDNLLLDLRAEDLQRAFLLAWCAQVIFLRFLARIFFDLF